MLKLRKLIKEHTWDREFGDPLVTFEDVMKKHQENKFKEDLDSVDKEDNDVDNDGDSDASDDYLKNRRDVISKAIEKESVTEGWWDNMGDAAKKAYIKKHGEAPGSAGGDDNGEDDYDMGEVPGSRGTGPWTPEDDPDFERGLSLTNAPGRVPDDSEPEDKPFGGDTGKDADYDMGEVPGSRGTGPWTPEDDPDFEHGPSLTSAPGRVPDEDEYPDKDPINTKKGEMEDEMEDIANELDNVTDPDEKKELEDRYDKIDQELYDINKKQYGDDSGYEKSGRTGKELDQETLTIDGKQFRRMSEGVEKQPKPKYAFSEFYQRFKRQEK